MSLVVEKCPYRRIPPDDFVEVGDHPYVGEAVEIREASTVRARDLDRRRAARVSNCLQRHPVHLGVRRADVSDRAVDDRLDGTTVEQSLYERKCCTANREPPETQRPGK